MKVVGVGGDHPCLEDSVQQLSSFPFELVPVVGSIISRPTHLHEMVLFQCSITIGKELQTKLLGSGLPSRVLSDHVQHAIALLPDEVSMFLCELHC